MADPFLAEIRIFAGNFAPSGWAFCNGQIMSISQNTALFSLLGTMYGGNGTTNFALPNLQGRAPLFHGQGNGLTNRSIGESSGAVNATILPSHMAPHTHDVYAGSAAGASESPVNGTWADTKGRRTGDAYVNDPSPAKNMNISSIDTTGGGAPHENRQPYLAVNFIIALQGIFPPRS